MEQPSYEITAHEMDKAVVDASSPGDITVSLQAGACCDLQPTADALIRVIRRVDDDQQQELLPGPLRLILVTPQLADAVSNWQRQLGLPEAGVSKQPEGVVVGKHMSWGHDKASARAIIILTDYIAAGVVAGEPASTAAVIHELGHVYDEFTRGLVFGFSEPQTPLRSHDWPGLCASFAEITWSEYAAESLAAGYLPDEHLHALMLNDSGHLAGVNTRLRESVQQHKSGQRDLFSLWQGAVTDISDLFANLGRAAARLPFAQNYEEALACLADPGGEAACWKPVIERLVRELESLYSKNYSQWEASPFHVLEKVIASGFEAVGLFPTHNGESLHIRVR